MMYIFPTAEDALKAGYTPRTSSSYRGFTISTENITNDTTSGIKYAIVAYRDPHQAAEDRREGRRPFLNGRHYGETVPVYLPEQPSPAGGKGAIAIWFKPGAWFAGWLEACADIDRWHAEHPRATAFKPARKGDFPPPHLQLSCK